MASSDMITEVEIQPDIQEVEIESMPVEIPCETVETTIVDESEDDESLHHHHHHHQIAAVAAAQHLQQQHHHHPGMITLQTLPEASREEEIILQTQEEIVGGDPLSVYDQIPVPDQADIYVESSPGPSRVVTTTTSGTKKKARKSASGAGTQRFRPAQAPEHAIFTEMPSAGGETKARKWEQKQVQIKTLEGEFSVTMWASGTDDGEYSLSLSLSLSPLSFSFLYTSMSLSLWLRLLFFASRSRRQRKELEHAIEDRAESVYKCVYVFFFI